jgi:hypothetical protein
MGYFVRVCLRSVWPPPKTGFPGVRNFSGSIELLQPISRDWVAKKLLGSDVQVMCPSEGRRVLGSLLNRGKAFIQSRIRRSVNPQGALLNELLVKWAEIEWSTCYAEL